MHRCRPDRWSPTFLAAQRYIIQPHTVKRWVGWWGWRGGGGGHACVPPFHLVTKLLPGVLEQCSQAVLTDRSRATGYLVPK